MQIFFRDIQYSIRALAKNPGFAVTAVLTLALGIGANTAVFSVVNAVLLRSLPYPHSERLVALSETSREAPDIAISYPDYLDWRAQQTAFEEMAARMPAGGIITGNDPERVIGRLVTASFFSTLGVQPFLGRGFNEAEDRPSGPHVMVLSYELWQRRFGSADPIGKSISYNGEPWTVVGVMPAGFDFYGRTNLNNDFLIPLGSLADQDFMRDRNSHLVRVIARLKPQASITQAQSQLNAIAGRLAIDYPASNAGVGAMTRSFLDDYVGDARRLLWVIFAAVGFLLLIACANVANLMLARATTRRREMALRFALGASRGRVVRQLLTESLILALTGGACGVFLATWGVKLLSRLNSIQLSRMDEVAIDARVLFFTFLITVTVGVLFGLVPALHRTSVSLNHVLKESARAISAGRGGRLRRSLIVGEVALALVVMVGAGLTVKSFTRLTSVEPGYDPGNVLTFRIRLPDAKYAESSRTFAFCREAMTRVRSLPGVERVAVTTGFPLGRVSDADYLVEGQSEQSPGRAPVAQRQDISEDYHKTLNIPLVEGRLFTSQDGEASPQVVIVDEEFARRHFPNQPFREVIGKRLRFAGDQDGWREIVGVVRHVKQSGLTEQSQVQIYRPWTQIPAKYRASFTRATDMIVKTSVDPYALVNAIRKEIRAIDNDQPIAQVQSLDDKLSESLAPQRLSVALLGLFSLTALLLAAVGIYGVMSYAVTLRTQEIGIRIALGARQLDVLKMVVGNGITLALIGVGVGLVLAFSLTRLMSSLLFEVTPTDPITFSIASMGLVIVALVACYAPARRATKVDPLVALRYE
jgi:putative ABC transport system permease protein